MSHTTSHTTIGSRLRDLRMNAGYTQGEIANALDMTQSMVLQIERGTKQLSLLNASILAEMFGCSINDLLKEVPNEHSDKS